MNFTATYLSYEETGSFSKTIIDYIAGNEKLATFSAHPVTIKGIKDAISARKDFPTQRKLLVENLQDKYAAIDTHERQKTNIDLLLNENTFTITTAHQPNIFTGPLYFIYKIVHVIRIADELNKSMPDNQFVPVFYMGSEDADLDELGHINVEGEKLEWKTDQKGAVGRMKVDKALIQLIDKLSGQLLIHPSGPEIIKLMRESYKEGVSIEAATFKIVNQLFSEYGLLVLLPDNPGLKRVFVPVMEKELLEGFSHKAVEATLATFPAGYKAQAGGRELNLFYLDENKRERIEEQKDKWEVINTELKFSKEQLLAELNEHPERFSPNVILRPVFQETILPNIVFIGGGGEIAYWLELRKVFEEARVPFPVMVMRNSFMIISKKEKKLLKKLGLSPQDLFKEEILLLNELVKRDSKLKLDVEKEKQELQKVYAAIKLAATAIDNSLAKHTETLEAKALKRIEALEKKMLKSERKRFEAQQRQLHTLRSKLFPANILQERMDNLLIYYSMWGKEFIHTIYQHSRKLEQDFCILEEN